MRNMYSKCDVHSKRDFIAAMLESAPIETRRGSDN